MAKPEVRRTLTGILQGLAHGIDLWTIWRDFCEIAAITISNRVDLTHYDERETRYLAIVKRYTRPQLDAFARAFGTLVDQLEEGIDDVLGRAFMDLELGNKWAGQFFTPFHLCRLTAELQIDDDLRAYVGWDDDDLAKFLTPPRETPVAVASVTLHMDSETLSKWENVVETIGIRDAISLSATIVGYLYANRSEIVNNDY